MSRNNRRYMRNSKISRQSRWRGLSRKWSFSLPKHRRFLRPCVLRGVPTPRAPLPASDFPFISFLFSCSLPFLSSIIFSILNSSIVSISCARFVKDKKLVNVVNEDFKNQRAMLIFHIRSWVDATLIDCRNESYSSMVIRMEGKIFRNFADFCESKKILEKHG